MRRHGAAVNQNYRGRATADVNAILSLASSFPVAGNSASSLEPMLATGLCAVDPDVQFTNRAFVFTGDSNRCERKELADHVTTRGGLNHQNVRKDTHYLVVCDGGSPYWAFSCYGRKVEQAVRYRKEGCPVVIVHERDFWDAIA